MALRSRFLRYISTEHPKVTPNSNSLILSPPNDPQAEQTRQSSSESSKSEPPIASGLPSAPPAPSQYHAPPFHTHAFFTALEKTFPEPVAQTLMRVTKALLIDRIGAVQRDGLTSKDLDNQAYLFRAALAELRAEMTMNTTNDGAAIRSGTTALRREVDKLDVKIKEDLAKLKHEIQIDMDSRKNEINDQFKRQDIAMEDIAHKALVRVNNLRTDVEEVKWNNMRRAVLTLFGFVGFAVVGMELRPKPPPIKTLPPPLPPQIPIDTTTEKMEWENT